MVTCAVILVGQIAGGVQDSVSKVPLPKLPVLGLGGSQLLAQVGNLGSVGVAVDHRLVADVARAVGVAQRLRALINVDVCWAHACNHGRLRVASQGVLHTRITLTSLPALNTAFPVPVDVDICRAHTGDHGRIGVARSERCTLL